jgi:Holliday junction resolvase
MMKHSKRKGYLAERKVRMILNEHGWTTIRSGGSLGSADLVCLWRGRCILIQVKSTSKSTFYTSRIPTEIQGFPLYVVVDFGYGNIRVFKPGEKATENGGTPLSKFLKSVQNSR